MFCCAACAAIQTCLGGGSIRLTDVAIGRRHMQHIVPVLVPSFAHRVCAETVDEGLDVVWVSVTTGEEEIFRIIGRWRGAVHYNRPQVRKSV
jgi:hypothetical protein